MQQLLIAALLCFSYVASAPMPQRFIPVFTNTPYENRGIFDFVGNWIQSSDWFPLEVNVPDTISGIGQGFQNIGGAIGGFVQGLPFWNRNNPQFQPRPLKYVVLMPIDNKLHPMQKPPIKSVPPNFNPFENMVAPFPSYP